MRRLDSRGKFLWKAQASVDCKILGDVAISPSAVLSPHSVILGPAKIKKAVFIGPHTVIGFPARRTLKNLLTGRGETKKGPVEIGANTIVRSGCVIYERVSVGRNVEFGHGVLLRENVSVGDGTLIGTNVIVDGHSVIGSGVSIQSGAYIPSHTTIRDGAFLGPNCVLTNDKYMRLRKTPLRGPTLEEGCSVGANAVILPGVTIGRRSLVGAGSVVTKNVEAGSVVVGVPAAKIKRIN